MSLRATGDGHISSIVFRSGTVNKKNRFSFDPISEFVETPDNRQDLVYDRHLFRLKLNEMNASNEISDAILGRLGETSTSVELCMKIEEQSAHPEFADPNKTLDIIY